LQLSFIPWLAGKSRSEHIPHRTSRATYRNTSFAAVVGERKLVYFQTSSKGTLIEELSAGRSKRFREDGFISSKHDERGVL
jgi:hypothetical protein